MDDLLSKNAELQDELTLARDERESSIRKFRRAEADSKILTAQIEQAKSEYKKLERSKKELKEDLHLAETHRHEHEMQIQRLSLELEQQIVVSNEMKMTNDKVDGKQNELLQNELDKRCEELTQIKLGFQQESAKANKQHYDAIQEIERQSNARHIELESRLTNLQIEHENRYENRTPKLWRNTKSNARLLLTQFFILINGSLV